MNDFQNILDEIFPFVESLLKEYGEFYPLSCTVNIEQKIEHVILEEDEENDNPKQTQL
jgi:hypothetical protein